MKNDNCISFPKAIYSDVTIQRAICDYSPLCRIEMVQDATKYVCCFWDCRVDLQLTIHEFANYLIELSNSRSEET